jgi:hypothetical protein
MAHATHARKQKSHFADRAMKFLKWFLIVAIVGLVAARLALPFVIRAQANKALNSIPDYYGSVDRVHVALWRGALVFSDIQITNADQNLALTVKDLGLHWNWFPLLRHMVVADLIVQSPRVRILTPKPSATGKVVKKEAEIAKKEAPTEKKKEPPKSFPDQLSTMIPFRVDRFAIYDGTVRVQNQGGHFVQQADKDKNKEVYTDQQEGGRELLIHKIDIEVDNLTNSKRDTGTKWAKGKIKATIMNSGEVLVTLAFNPTAPAPLFDLNLQEKNLDLTELNPVIDWQTGMDIKHGVFELYAEAAAADGSFKGYIKPFIENLKMLDISKDKKKGIGKVIKQAVVGAVAFVFKNHKEDEISTKLPFSGKFENPKVGIWEAVIEVLRNAFIKALAPALENSVNVNSVR